jgi:dihydroflavonol-4-reductase
MVTGAGSLLGSNLVRRLIDAGHTVTVLLQKGRNTGTLDDLSVRKIYGDILDSESLHSACSKVDMVIHAAALVSIWPSRSELVRKINITGTRNMLECAKKHDVKLFIYIGTANSFSPGSKEQPGNEQTPFICGKYHLDYIDSKYEAQKLVLNTWETEGFPTLTINPTFMIGPYDSRPSSGEMLLGLYHRRIPGYTPGGKCFIHVQDVADAVVNALTIGKPGNSYIAGNANLSYKEFFTTACGVMGVPAPRIPIPRVAALLGGAAASAGSALTGKSPSLSFAMARVSCDGHYYDGSKAAHELGMPKTSIETAIEDCFIWMKEYEML